MDGNGDKLPVEVSESKKPRVSKTTADDTNFGELFSPKSNDTSELDLGGSYKLEISFFGISTSLRV
jgi:predicted RNA-binding protein (virulence factor B family)